MQANLKKIGFDLAIKKVPNDGYWGAVWMKEPMNVVSWNMRPTANAQMAIQFAPGAAWNDHLLEQRPHGRAAHPRSSPRPMPPSVTRCSARCRP